jgi:CobQ-like glutamine amidotransferase family enzyme
MIIEFIYPEIANLLGEHGHLMFLRRLFPDARLIETPAGELPAFLESQVDFVFMGPMSENNQKEIAVKWHGFKAIFRRRFEAGLVGLFTGNAFDLFGETISYEGKSTVKALGLAPFRTIVRRYDRTNNFVWGRTGDIDVFGPRSQFTYHEGSVSNMPFLTVEEGEGTVPGEPFEGVQIGNTIATELLGPLLIQNPALTKALFPGRTLPFEDALFAAARQRQEDRRAGCTKEL